MLKVGVIGATGYAGVETVKLLLGHPNATLSAISSVSFEGQKLSDVYPAFCGVCDMVLVGEKEAIAASDLLICALPAGLSEQIAKTCSEKNKRVIDIGSDFRLHDPSDYEEWYQLSYRFPELHERALYCIPELHGAPDESLAVVANPGCYPTSVALAAAPAMRAGLCKLSFIADCKSGLSGAGRKPTQSSHFVDVNEGFCAYKAPKHRHTPEIEQTLSELCGEQVTMTFVPHLLPVNRGILSTVYLDLCEGVTEEDVRKVYHEAYDKCRFVRVLGAGLYANINHVAHSNFCEISLHYDARTHRLIVCSAIDNVVKGAAGQAIQNMNLWYGFAEDAGLSAPPSVL